MLSSRTLEYRQLSVNRRQVAYLGSFPQVGTERPLFSRLKLSSGRPRNAHDDRHVPVDGPPGLFVRVHVIFSTRVVPIIQLVEGAFCLRRDSGDPDEAIFNLKRVRSVHVRAQISP